MKKLITVFLLFLLIAPFSGQAKNLRAFLNYSIFNHPTEGPYLETYLSVYGKSVNFVRNDNGMYQSVIEITLIFKEGEKITDFDKYELFSPEVSDTNQLAFDFLDQQRYFLPEGNYELVISILDKNGNKKPFSASQPIEIGFEQYNVCFSGIELVDSFTQATEQSILTKSGYDIIPMVHNFYPETRTKMGFYTEIYNSVKYFGQAEKFLVSCFVESFETGNIMKDFICHKRLDTRDVVPILNEFDISSLPSGNYKLAIEARDKSNKLVSRNEIFFQRSNPSIELELDDLAAIDVSKTFAYSINNKDTLNEFIRCLAPRATELEKNFIYKQLDNADIRTKQQFFYNFWKTRDEFNPARAWMDYYDLVRIVNAAYKTQIHKGYETDRGRVYLQYGPPNIISESYNEPSSYPFEIWHYYELGDRQRNKRFVFYTYDLITNNFKLLHSDAIGEVYNYRWQVFLNNRWFDPYNMDVDKSPDIYGGRADDYYRNPR